MLARSEVPVSVSSTIASTRRALTSVAPQLNSTRTRMPLSSKYRFVTPSSSVAMIPPSRSSGFVDLRLVRHREHPSRRIARGLAVGQLAHLVDVAAVLLDPVETGDAHVQDAVPDVAADLLGPQVHELNFLVVDRGKITPFGVGNMQSRLVEQIHRRLLQAPCGKAEFQNSFTSHIHSIFSQLPGGQAAAVPPASLAGRLAVLAAGGRLLLGQLRRFAFPPREGRRIRTRPWRRPVESRKPSISSSSAFGAMTPLLRRYSIMSCVSGTAWACIDVSMQ